MTDPNHTHRPAHMMDARHSRALFPAPAAPDSRSTVGILTPQGDVREYSLALKAAGARPVVVCRAADLGEVPGHRLDGPVVPGGELTTMSTLLITFEMLAPLCELIGVGLSTYGSCAGMIMLADRIEGVQEGQAFLDGIDMTVRRNASGRQVDSYEEDLITSELGAGPDQPLRAVFTRAPWVEEVGPGVEILAMTCAGRAVGVNGADGDRTVAVRQGSLLAMSFRPEVGDDYRVYDIFVSMVTRRA